MIPEEILDRALTSLRETRRTLMSQDWEAEIAGRSPEEKRQAATTLSSVQKAVLALENAELAEIRAKLAENETGLIKGAGDLQRALGNLQDVKKVLDAVNAFLSIAARIAPLFI